MGCRPCMVKCMCWSHVDALTQGPLLQKPSQSSCEHDSCLLVGLRSKLTAQVSELSTNLNEAVRVQNQLQAVRIYIWVVLPFPFVK
jgi:hypothetical protein